MKDEASAIVQRLVAESVFACGVALSFILAYGFWVESETRWASPTSMWPLYYPALGCAAFSIGLHRVLFKERNEKPWDGVATICLATGLVLNALNVMCPSLWR